MTSDLLEAARAKNTPLEAKNGMKESIYWKKNNQSCSTTSKNPWRVQSDLSYDYSQER